MQNKFMDLEELHHPFFREVNAQLEMLLKSNPAFYLHPSKRWEYPWALQRAGLRAGSRVLDLGCGGSIFPVYLKKEGFRVHALDLSFPFLERPACLPPIAYVRARMQSLPYQEGIFDGVFCISVIEHLPIADRPHALAEITRILKPGGILLLTTDYNRDADEKIWYEGPGQRFKVDWHVFDARELARLVAVETDLQLWGTLPQTIDWDRTRPRMRDFHGYPYTSVGLAFKKKGPFNT